MMINVLAGCGVASLVYWVTRYLRAVYNRWRGGLAYETAKMVRSWNDGEKAIAERKISDLKDQLEHARREVESWERKGRGTIMRLLLERKMEKFGQHRRSAIH